MSFLGNCCIGRKSFQALSASRSFSLQPEPADARPTAGINHVQCHNTQFYTRLTLSSGLIDHNQKITVAALTRAGMNTCASISGCVETPWVFEISQDVIVPMWFTIRRFSCGKPNRSLHASIPECRHGSISRYQGEVVSGQQVPSLDYKQGLWFNRCPSCAFYPHCDAPAARQSYGCRLAQSPFSKASHNIRIP